MKEKELREAADCASCGRKIGACGLPVFWRITIERHGVKLDAIQRQQGLTMMLGGHAALAMVMGADEEMTIPMMDPVTITVCEECSVKNITVIEMAAAGSK
jgi:hypothetical protein